MTQKINVSLYFISYFTIFCVVFIIANDVLAQKVFILMSYNHDDKCGGPQFHGVTQALNETILPLNVKAYFLKSKLLSRKEVHRRQKEAIKFFKDFDPDVTITIDDLAFQTLAKFFLNKKGHGHLVFTGTNISPEQYNKRFKFHINRTPTARITGIYEKLFIPDQLKFASLITGKKAKHVAVLYTKDPLGKIIVNQIKQEIKGSEWEKKIIFLMAQNTKEIKRLGELIQNDNSIDWYIPVILSLPSETGRLTIKDLAPLITSSILKPDLTINSTFVDLGFLGGISVNFEAMGREAGQRALLLLRGFDVSLMEIQDAREKTTVINLDRCAQLGLKLSPESMAVVDRFIRCKK